MNISFVINYLTYLIKLYNILVHYIKYKQKENKMSPNTKIERIHKQNNTAMVSYRRLPFAHRGSGGLIAAAPLAPACTGD
jgi:hypothetical protein